MSFQNPVQAPLVLAVCAVPGEAWTRSRYDGYERWQQGASATLPTP